MSVHCCEGCNQHLCTDCDGISECEICGGVDCDDCMVEEDRHECAPELMARVDAIERSNARLTSNASPSVGGEDE